MNPTPCTTPAAPFYALDVRLLGYLESLGIDAPCDMIAGGFALGMGIAVFALAAVIYAAARLYAEAVRAKIAAARFDSLN